VEDLGLLRDLDRQPAQLFQRQLDLVLRLGALGHIQLDRDARQPAVGPPCEGNHHVQITRQLHHRWIARSFLPLPLCLQKQLRLLQEPVANCGCSSPPGGI
jgi:hypothetical protein